MSAPLRSSQGALWMARNPGDSPEYIGCVDLDDIAEPQGDLTPSQCRNRDGVIETIGMKQAPPGLGTSGFEALVYPEANILDEIAKSKCPVTLFALQRTCGRADDFLNYTRGYVLYPAYISSRGYGNVVKRTDDEESTQRCDISFQALYRLREVVAARQTIAETRALNDIGFCNSAQCAGDCGEQKDKGTEGQTVSDGNSPSPIADADVWGTVDKGVNWANLTGLLNTPFHAGVDIMGHVCFPMGKDTTRILVAKWTEAGQHLEISYSDDGGVTWTIVEVATVDSEGCTDGKALFALDWQHIWLGTTLGRIYFSNDGGLTWVSQTTALTVSGANQINAVQFTDFENGWAVGNNDVVMRTVDGGDTWAMATVVPTSSDHVLSLDAFTKHRAIIGSNAGEIFETLDAGATWTAKTYTGQLTTDLVRDFSFPNDLVGFMIVNKLAGVGTVYRTKDGGGSWEAIVTPTNAGLNVVEAIDENTAYVVGEVSGGTAVVLKVSG